MSHLIDSNPTHSPCKTVVFQQVFSQQVVSQQHNPCVPSRPAAWPPQLSATTNVQKLYGAWRRTKSLQSAASILASTLACTTDNATVHAISNATGNTGKQNSPGRSQPARRIRRWPSGRHCSSIAALAFATTCAHTQASSVFINELHYDNDGTDVFEGVEIVALAGHNLDGWQLQFYNGSNGGVYKTVELAGTIIDQYNGYGMSHAATSGLQNGPADGVALINSAGGVLEFISYEGALTAAEGAAAGMTSIDIGVAETSTLALGLSLQRQGSGSLRDDFSWTVANASFGAVNDNQNLLPAASPVPLPAGAALFTSALAGLIVARRQQFAAKG